MSTELTSFGSQIVVAMLFAGALCFMTAGFMFFSPDYLVREKSQKAEERKP